MSLNKKKILPPSTIQKKKPPPPKKICIYIFLLYILPPSPSLSNLGAQSNYIVKYVNF